MDALNDKIVTIIDRLGFSNTKFADAISVSRPTISHIISGRNKPSIDIIQKIIAKYPELGYKWFLDDEELDSEKLTELANNQGDLPITNLDSSTPDLINQQYDSPRVGKTQPNALTSGITEDSVSSSLRRVERVIMFYSDGSMEVLSGAPQIL